MLCPGRSREKFAKPDNNRSGQDLQEQSLGLTSGRAVMAAPSPARLPGRRCTVTSARWLPPGIRGSWLYPGVGAPEGSDRGTLTPLPRLSGGTVPPAPTGGDYHRAGTSSFQGEPACVVANVRRGQRGRGQSPSAHLWGGMRGFVLMGEAAQDGARGNLQEGSAALVRTCRVAPLSLPFPPLAGVQVSPQCPRRGWRCQRGRRGGGRSCAAGPVWSPWPASGSVCGEGAARAAQEC